MTPSAPPSVRAARRRGPVLVASALLALAAGAPAASAAEGVYKGTGADAAGDARSDFDLLGVDVAYNRSTGTFRATIRIGSKPPGDVDVLLGARQSNGACGMPFVTLNTNVAAGTGEWRGSGGRARAKARVSYANGVISASVTDGDLKGRTPSCAMGMSYGAGAAHPLRDTLPAFDVAERVSDPGGEEEPPPEETVPPEEVPPTEGVDTDGDGVPDDFDGDGLPDDLGTGYPGDAPSDGSEGGFAPKLSVRVYGLPRRLARGRSYEARIRIRNDGDVDATKLRVRLARKFGVAMSRRVASVSRVRAGKGVTVHVRVRLTSRQRLRTVRVTVSGEGVEERTSMRLRRRGAR